MMKMSARALVLSVLTAGMYAENAPRSLNEPLAENSVFPALPTTVVTGDQWESELESTTAGVSVIGEDVLSANGKQHFQDIVNAIPNLTWTGGTSRPRYIQIRGIGENSQFEGETPDSSVLFLIDDIDLSGLATVGSLFDVRQVEVLRGPQVGAGGANAAGGVVHIVTNGPTPYWTGQIEGTMGTDGLFAGGVAVGGPVLESVPEQLTFRVMVYQHLSDGFRQNHFLEEDDTNERDEFSSRLKVCWIANEDWQWDGALFYAGANNGYDEFSLNNTGFDTFSDTPGRDEQETFGSSLRGTCSGLDAADFTTHTSFTGTDSLYSYDADWTDPSNPSAYNGYLATKRERDVFSEEFRLDGIEEEAASGWLDRWTFGFYFQHLKEDTVVDYADDFGGLRATSLYETENFAVFGQIAHNFAASTRLTVGFRYEYYTIDVDAEGRGSGFYVNPLNGGSHASGPLMGGKLTLEHDLDKNHLVFGSITRGYKAGGANVASFTTPGDPLTYETEILWNYEIGLRGNWFHEAVVSQITAFYLDRHNAQLRDSKGAGGFFRYLSVNGGDAAHYGLETEATWLIDPNWALGAGLGLLETTRESYTDPGGVVASRDLANAPAYTYNVSIDYRADCGFLAHAELVGRDSYYESNSHNEKRDAYAVINASLGYHYKNWTLTLWARNLFDEDYQKRVFFFANEGPDFDRIQRYEDPADPRQFGATLNYSW